VAVTVRREVLQKAAKTVATGDDGNTGNVGMNGFQVTIGLGRISQVNDQTGCLLAGVPLLPGQLVKQASRRLHGLAIG